MIPPLPSIDIFDFTPDRLDIDIWSQSFDITSIPDAPCCYAFISQRNGELVYIGAACSWCPMPNERWLRIRMRQYTGTKRKSTNKIRAENSHNPLYMQCWIMACESDALKCEWEAIRKYRPRLNTVGVAQRRTLAEYKASKKRSASKLADKFASTKPDPKALRICRRCGVIKESRLFSLNRRKKFGSSTICKLCRRIERQRKNGHMFIESIVDGICNGYMSSICNLTIGDRVCLGTTPDSEVTEIRRPHGKHARFQRRYLITDLSDKTITLTKDLRWEASAIRNMKITI